MFTDPLSKHSLAAVTVGLIMTFTGSCLANAGDTILGPPDPASLAIPADGAAWVGVCVDPGVTFVQDGYEDDGNGVISDGDFVTLNGVHYAVLATHSVCKVWFGVQPPPGHEWLIYECVFDRPDPHPNPVGETWYGLCGPCGVGETVITDWYDYDLSGDLSYFDEFPWAMPRAEACGTIPRLNQTR